MLTSIPSYTLSESARGAVTKIPVPGGLKQQKCVPHSSRGWTTKIKVPAESVSGEAYAWCMASRPLTVSSHSRWAQELSEVSFLRALIPS